MSDFENYIPEGHEDIEVFHIGTIIFNDEILTEKEVNINKRFKPKSIGECKVEVYSGEGQIPHFHIYNNDHSFDTCVCIHSANYFSHGNKYKDKFNSKQCKELDQWLRNQFNEINTIWEIIRGMWEVSNPYCKFPNYLKVTKQPDYTKMKDFRDRI